MVGIKGKGDVPHKWEKQIPMYKMIDMKQHELYGTYMDKDKAEEGKNGVLNMSKSMNVIMSCKVVPTKIKSEGIFTVYCVYAHAKMKK